MVKDFTAVGYLAVGVLVLALFVGAVVGLVKLSQNLNNKGTAMLQKGTAQLMEFEYTQYDEKIITGSEVKFSLCRSDIGKSTCIVTEIMFHIGVL